MGLAVAGPKTFLKNFKFPIDFFKWLCYNIDIIKKAAKDGGKRFIMTFYKVFTTEGEIFFDSDEEEEED